MGKLLIYISSLLLLLSCNLEDQEFENPTDSTERVRGEIKVANAELRRVENPMGSEVNPLQLIGYAVREILPSGERKPYLRGLGYWDELLSLEFIPNKQYIIQLSVVAIDPNHDLTKTTQVFGRYFQNGFQNVLEYYPFELGGNNMIYPFNTEIRAYLNETYQRSIFYYSDKFVGETIFEVPDEEFDLNVEMYRLSGRLALEATNLEKGNLVIEFTQRPTRSLAFSMGLYFPDSAVRQERPAIRVRFDDDELIDRIREEIGDDNGGWRRGPRPDRRRGSRMGTNFEAMLSHHYEDERGIQRQRNIGLLDTYLERNVTVTYRVNMANYPIENARQTGEMEFLDVEVEYSDY